MQILIVGDFANNLQWLSTNFPLIMYTKIRLEAFSFGSNNKTAMANNETIKIISINSK